MIEKRTVLILGAGSSYEVGFPLGKELIWQIYAFVQGNSLGYSRDGQGQIIDKVLSNATLLWKLLEISGVKKEDGGAYSVDDIKHFAVPILTHRIILQPEYWVSRQITGEVISDALSKTPVPVIS